MLTAKVERSLRKIIYSKKKVLEIQHVIDSNVVEGSKIIQSYESSIQKLNFIESCILDNEYTIINLLREDRYEQLSMKEIYNEFQRELTVPNQYQKQTEYIVK